MGEIKIILPDEIEYAFRKAAMACFGYQKGAMSVAAKEAIINWNMVNQETSEKDIAKNSLRPLIGILKHIKKSSVEVQHEAWEHILKKHANRH